MMTLITASLRSRLADSLPFSWWRVPATSMEPSQWPACVVAFHRVWDQSRDELSVSHRLFRQLCLHWKHNYHVVPLDEILGRLEKSPHAPDGSRPLLAITFDDGYADNSEIAAPILKEMELPATFFITTEYMGTRRRFPWDNGIEPQPRMMTWRQVRELAQAGFSIGSHTCNHVRLSQCDPKLRRRELVQSRQTLEQQLGQPVLDFAYPFGGASDCRSEDRDAVREAGYRSCLSCHGGLVHWQQSPYRLQRICVSPRYHRNVSAWERQYRHAVQSLLLISANASFGHPLS
jgi:peptidoglycan/xylan/chitin deacetylase (PgdA/CDA1 family)